MALVRKKMLTPVLLAIVFLLSFFWHKSVFQVSEPTVPQPIEYHLQSHIDAVFGKLQSLIPNVTFTTFSRSTSGKNSKVSIVNQRERYCVGEDLVVQVDMYDHLGNRKTYGGDFIRSRLFSPKLGAAVSGRVEDFQNGSFHIHFPLRWVDSDKAKVSMRLWHPSEGIAALWRARHASLGVLGFQGRYEYLGKEAISTCGFQPNTAKEFCEYKDELYEEAFYCIKPKDLPCECLKNMRAVDLQVSYLTPEEKSLFQGSNVGVEMAQGLEILVTDCGNPPQTPKPKCQTGMNSSFPSGYFYNYTWNPVNCGMTVYKTGDDFTKCLQGKNLFLIGDSTLRQYMMHFTETIQIVKYFRHHESGWSSWEKTLEAINMDKDIYVSYKRHGFPLESFMFYYFKEDMYTSRQIDQRGGGQDTIFVITMGQHFRQFPIKLYIRRAINIRRAVERLLIRSPETKVIIKTENTREGVAPQERIGDFHGYSQYLVLREVFQGINVGFVDAWDMTVAASTESVHPPGFTFDSILSLTFTFAC
ncbi:NXPE family member 4-like [Rhinoderma darwinii]|uniref:NXPE family member 4-like n=1 Tax=Rhinoderma darwinii TaxID=43563 RepID=UPI003F679C2C